MCDTHQLCGHQIPTGGKNNNFRILFFCRIYSDEINLLKYFVIIGSKAQNSFQSIVIFFTKTSTMGSF